MESSDIGMFHEKRYELRGGCSDQGTEKGMGDDSIRSVHGHEEYESDDANSSFLFPRMLMMAGMLHILYNALQDAILSVPESKTFLDQLRFVDHFSVTLLSVLRFPISAWSPRIAVHSCIIPPLILIGNGNSYPRR